MSTAEPQPPTSVPAFPSREYSHLLPPDQEHELSGLPNRVAFATALTLASTMLSGQFSLVAIDLDHMKDINDSQGHTAGDKHIRAAANVLEFVTRADDLVISLQDDTPKPAIPIHNSGDEFYVILPGITRQEALDKVMTRFQGALACFGIAASMGGRPHQDGESAEDLNADVEILRQNNKLKRKLTGYAGLEDEILQHGDALVEKGVRLRDLPIVYSALVRRRAARVETEKLEQPALFEFGAVELFE
jgi:diguanylate cyclase (GGDEF)-like protein